MTTLLSQRDIEILSTYLDGQLTDSEGARLESRLQAEIELRTTLEEMRRTRAILRSAPILRAPHNYTLKPGMVKSRQRIPRAYPVLRLASVLASFLFILAFVGDLIGQRAPALAPVVMVQQVEAPTAVVMEGAASTEQMTMQSKAPAPPAAELALAPQPTPTATETATVAGSQMETLSSLPAATQASVEPGPDSGYVMRQTTEAQPEQPAIQTEAEDQSEIKQEASPGWWNSLRIFEVVALIFALVTGLAAFFLRRTGGGY
jgi:hypothetical protein